VNPAMSSPIRTITFFPIYSFPFFVYSNIDKSNFKIGKEITSLALAIASIVEFYFKKEKQLFSLKD